MNTALDRRLPHRHGVLCWTPDAPHPHRGRSHGPGARPRPADAAACPSGIGPSGRYRPAVHDLPALHHDQHAHRRRHGEQGQIGCRLATTAASAGRTPVRWWPLSTSITTSTGAWSRERHARDAEHSRRSRPRRAGPRSPRVAEAAEPCRCRPLVTTDVATLFSAMVADDSSISRGQPLRREGRPRQPESPLGDIQQDGTPRLHRMSRSPDPISPASDNTCSRSHHLADEQRTTAATGRPATGVHQEPDASMDQHPPAPCRTGTKSQETTAKPWSVRPTWRPARSSRSRPHGLPRRSASRVRRATRSGRRGPRAGHRRARHAGWTRRGHGP
ncbi:hypothetical protein JYK04_00615 [Streptomyces nojiriensis]|nr:hypothetical protein JYK04_00615 [Streptomyces nojiriensis]